MNLGARATFRFAVLAVAVAVVLPFALTQTPTSLEPSPSPSPSPSPATASKSNSDAWVVQPANHWLFQIANGFLLLSYLMIEILYLRVLLAAAMFFFTTWGLVILRVSVDTTVWNFVFLTINIGHIIKILYDRRPLKFDPDREFIWQYIFFRYYNMDRHTFAALTETCVIRTYKAGTYYAKKGDLVANLSLIIEGRVGVFIPKKNAKSKLDGYSEDDMVQVNELKSLDFLDSPEWMFGHDKYGIWLRCITDCRIFSWPFLTIKKFEKDIPHLRGAMNGCLARDLSLKLLAVQDELLVREQERKRRRSRGSKRRSRPENDQDEAVSELFSPRSPLDNPRLRADPIGSGFGLGKFTSDNFNATQHTHSDGSDVEESAKDRIIQGETSKKNEERVNSNREEVMIPMGSNTSGDRREEKARDGGIYEILQPTPVKKKGSEGKRKKSKVSSEKNSSSGS